MIYRKKELSSTHSDLCTYWENVLCLSHARARLLSFNTDNTVIQLIMFADGGISK